jgi:hypothetical protein
MVFLVVALTSALALAVLLAGAALSCWVTRRTLVSRLGAFRCNVRAPGRPAAGFNERWRRRSMVGLWVHDALVLVSGTWRTRVRPLPVRFAEDLTVAPSGLLRGLGTAPVVLALHLDDGAVLLLAAPHEARAEVGGPFLVTQLRSTRLRMDRETRLGKREPGAS